MQSWIKKNIRKDGEIKEQVLIVGRRNADLFQLNESRDGATTARHVQGKLFSAEFNRASYIRTSEKRIASKSHLELYVPFKLGDVR